MEAKEYIDRIRDEPEVEIRWALKNATNDMLIDILIELMQLLKLYQIKDNLDRN